MPTGNVSVTSVFSQTLHIFISTHYLTAFVYNPHMAVRSHGVEKLYYILWQYVLNGMMIVTIYRLHFSSTTLIYRCILRDMTCCKLCVWIISKLLNIWLYQLSFRPLWKTYSRYLISFKPRIYISIGLLHKMTVISRKLHVSSVFQEV